MIVNKAKKIVASMLLYIEQFDRWGIIESIRKVKEKKVQIVEAEKLESAQPIIMNWPKSIKKPYVGLVKSEEGPYAYWPKFERFLINNNIPYDFIDIKCSDFINKVNEFDIIVWRTPSTYSDQWESKSKIEFIHNIMGKMTLPNKESLWYYEDKTRQQWLFDYFKLPSIKTFISYSKEETLEFIKNVKYPIISKDKTSAGSRGVMLIKNKASADKLVRKIFSVGKKLNESYIKQKNYVLFQEKVPNKGFDLRVIIVGNSYFGYYRYPKKGDFRASGSGIITKEDIPKEVLLLAKKVKERLPKSYLLAVDFLQDIRDGRYYIIETSIFISIESSEQLVVNGISGRYIEKNGEFIFEPGRFWLQELMMEELMKDWIRNNQ